MSKREKIEAAKMEPTIWSKIPEELLIEILIRVPIKFLVRLTQLSKSWYALITSHGFIFTHVSKLQADGSDRSSRWLLRFGAKCVGTYLLCSDDYFDLKSSDMLHPYPTFDGYYSADAEDDFPAKIEVPLTRPHHDYRIVGSCNGLHCFSNNQFGESAKPIVVWNPSIEKSVELPLPSIHPDSDRSLVGFGCDLLGLDYKVVRIVIPEEGNVAPAQTEVYSLVSKGWKVVASVPNCQVIKTYSPVLVNGVLHWLTHEEDRGSMFLGFNLKYETFSEISLPEDLAGQPTESLRPFVKGDRLAVMKYDKVQEFGSIWVMKEYGNVYSWEMLHEFGMAEGIDGVIGFAKNGHCLATMGNGLASFDPQNSRKVKIYRIGGTENSLQAVHFVESLVLLEGRCRF
ncbi:OLC1v1004996C1 [Oldenlandia corymbosa var. corymbosa]|uniref:OLC1v1004996C1 n=1 Tax=Oldenlandia corymbosa var. corymbosa TaxID=529605 RepID=A0AAV1DDL0_OLDCO|nr:OLC1v1004996C1 [Oldenlandia corymbosa var. corymbosa]